MGLGHPACSVRLGAWGLPSSSGAVHRPSVGSWCWTDKPGVPSRPVPTLETAQPGVSETVFHRVPGMPIRAYNWKGAGLRELDLGEENLCGVLQDLSGLDTNMCPGSCEGPERSLCMI